MHDLSAQEGMKNLNLFLEDKAVLVIDPSANFRTSIKQFLANLKVKKTIVCANTNEANQSLWTQEVGLVIIEWLAGKENGLEFCRKLKKQKRYRDLPFLLITSENLTSDVSLASEVEVAGYLLKPFSYEVFAQKLFIMAKKLLNPSESFRSIQKAVNLLHDQEYSQAEQILSHTVDRDPESATAYYYLAVAANKLGQRDKALSFVEKACELNPKFIKALSYYLELADQCGFSIDSLLKIGLRLHKLSPDNPRYTLRLATLYLKKLDLETSEELFKKTIVLSPKIASAYVGLGHIELERKDFQAAQKNYQKALDIDASDISILNSLGMSYVRMGKFTEGVQNYLAALRIEPEDPRILFNLGQAYEKNKDLETALKYYNEVIDLSPKFEKAGKAIVRVSDQIGNLKNRRTNHSRHLEDSSEN